MSAPSTSSSSASNVFWGEEMNDQPMEDWQMQEPSPQQQQQQNQDGVRHLEDDLERLKLEKQKLEEDNKILSDTNQGLIQINNVINNTPNGQLNAWNRHLHSEVNKLTAEKQANLARIEHETETSRRLQTQLEELRLAPNPAIIENQALRGQVAQMTEHIKFLEKTPNGELYAEARRAIEERERKIQDLQRQLRLQGERDQADIIIEREILRQSQDGAQMRAAPGPRAPSVDRKDVALIHHAAPTRRLDFDDVVAQWESWPYKNALVEGVALEYFLFNPHGPQRVPQQVRKVSRNMDLFNIMFHHNNPNVPLMGEWNKVDVEGKKKWATRRVDVKKLQDMQIRLGWIEMPRTWTGRVIKQEIE